MHNLTEPESLGPGLGNMHSGTHTPNLKMTYWSSAHTPLVLHSVYALPTQAPQLCALAIRAWPVEAQM